MNPVITPPPVSLYIHLPWCVRKCPYCDFNSHEHAAGVFPEEDYIDALIRDLEYELPRIQGRDIKSIFIGGGTPSLFSGTAIRRLLTEIFGYFPGARKAEVTLEANPGSVDGSRFGSYRESGVNRLSLGIQSFDDVMLKSIGRIHDGAMAEHAIKLAKSIAFDNLNLDIMYGLPGQDRNAAMQDLEKVIGAGPAHVSWYQLTIEPNTKFYKERPRLPHEDIIWDIQETGMALLQSAGYINYEVSAFAYNGRQCQHNLNYWEFGDYVGLGAGAHGKFTDPSRGRIIRSERHRVPGRYMALAGTGDVITRTRVLDEDDIRLEFMMNALRLTDGFTHSLFERRTGMSCENLEDCLPAAVNKGWLEINTDRVRTTVAGRNYLNDLLQLFMPGSTENSARTGMEYV